MTTRTDRITKLQQSHPWMSADVACKLLVANYVVHNKTADKPTPITLHQSMEAYTDKLCGLSEAGVKDIISRVEGMQ